MVRCRNPSMEVIAGFDGGFNRRDVWPNSPDFKSERHVAGNYTLDDHRHSMEQPEKMMPIDLALNEYCGIPTQAYALAVVQPDGRVKTFLSEGMKTSPKSLFPASFQDEFLWASGRSAQSQFDYRPIKYSEDSDADMEDLERCRRQSTSTDSSHGRRDSAYRVHKVRGDKLDNDLCRAKKSRKRPKVHRSAEKMVRAVSTKQLALGDTAGIREFYVQCLKDLQQFVGRIIAKALVKLIEPKKQTTYPYSGGAATAPPWWPPTSGEGAIRHTEPDHLHKRERIILLVQILDVVLDQNRSKSEALQPLRIKDLEETALEAAAAWFNEKNKPKNAEKRVFLKDIFKVAKMEERYRRGEIDATATMTIIPGARVDHSLTDDEDDLEEAHMATLGHNTPDHNILTPDSLVSPHATHLQSTAHLRPDDVSPDAFATYSSLRGVPPRAYASPLHSTAEEQQHDFPDTPFAMPQPNYLARPAANVAYHQHHPALALHDPSRRASWQQQQPAPAQQDYQSPPAAPMYQNWPAASPAMGGHIPPSPLHYAQYTANAAAPPVVVASPALPQQQGALRPPPYLPSLVQQHQSFEDGLQQQQQQQQQQQRPFEGARVGGMGMGLGHHQQHQHQQHHQQQHHQQQQHQQHQGFGEYLGEGPHQVA